MMNMAADTKGKVITCKAAVAWGPGEPLVLQEVRVDPPKDMEVRLNILFTSICHTDLIAWAGENEAQRAFPRILGHEAVGYAVLNPLGVVESIGEGVKDIKEGDYVIPICTGECGECPVCKEDKGTNLCQKFQVDPMKKVMVSNGKPRFFTKDYQPIYHFLNTSTFVEYTVLDSACVVKIDPICSLKHMSLLSCGVATGVGAAWNVANVKAGTCSAIFGLGSVGLAVAQGARARGASRIIGVETNPTKFEKGKLMGITDFLNPSDLINKPLHQRIREMTGGGVDYSFECIGNVDVLREAFLSSLPGWGSTVLVGVYATPRTLPLHPMELFDGRSITGSVFGGFKPKTHLPHLARLCSQGVVKLEPFITHELPFEKINEAFQLLRHGKTLRCLLHLSKFLMK